MEVTRTASLGDGAAEAERGELLGVGHHGSELGDDGGAALEAVALLGAGLVAHLDGRALDGQGGDGAALLLGEGGAQVGGEDGEAGHGSGRLVDLRESYHGGGVGVNPPRRAQTGVERSVAQKARRAVLALRRRGSMVGFGPVWRPLKKAAL